MKTTTFFVTVVSDEKKYQEFVEDMGLGRPQKTLQDVLENAIYDALRHGKFTKSIEVRPGVADMFNDVGEFHSKFNLENTTHGLIGPRPWDQGMIDFRIKFLQEELNEFQEGIDEADLAKMFDALLDLVYVACGTGQMLGFPWYEGWKKVQEANMKKERVTRIEDSKRGSTFDVKKPEGWQPPDIAGVLAQYGWIF